MGKAVDTTSKTTRVESGPAAIDGGSVDMPPSYDAPPYEDNAGSSEAAPATQPPPPAPVSRPAPPAQAQQTGATAVAPSKAFNRRIPPPGAQRAVAPLTITRNDKSIKEDYVVSIGENKRGPDVRLETNDARIDSFIYLTGSVPRAAVVEAVTDDSSIRLRVQREEGQAVEIHAKTNDSRVHLWLPHGFDGLVTARVKGGKAELSPSLRNVAVLWPGASEKHTQTWAIRLGKDRSTTDEPGPDRAYAQTKDAGIRIYADTDDEAGEGDKCVIC